MLLKYSAFAFLLTLSLLVGSCSDESYVVQGEDVLISAVDKFEGTTTAGNLVASAIRKTHDLDVVFYPTELLNEESFALLSRDMSEFDRQKLLEIYPPGTKDQFKLGSMRGSAIKEFVRDRARERYHTDLQVAGMRYHINYVGGIPGFANFTGYEGQELEDDKRYRVAISKFYYFSGETFPSYKYRSGLNFGLTEEDKVVSARESLKKYLERDNPFLRLREHRARVSRTRRGNAGRKSIPKIQGGGHRSPYYGMEVVTEGIVTAVGSVDWYPGGTDVYIQDPRGDGNPKTSDALHVYLENEEVSLKLGDKVRVRGIVYEQLADNGLGKTSLREVQSVQVISEGHLLPEPVKIGSGGRSLPRDAISTYRGNLNRKVDLDLSEGIDFWESLEGMRISLRNPRILDFRGGRAEHEDDDAKGYLNLYLLPDGDQNGVGTTHSGGLMIDEEKNDFNPEILQLSANHLTRGMDTETIYRVGDLINGELEGVLSYEKNIFGGGEFALVLPKKQSALEKLSTRLNNQRGMSIPSHKDRPKTHLKSDSTSLTVATYNVKNLAGFQKKRIRATGKVISHNMRCPDIVNLVEIQDNNGTDFFGGASADVTLKRVIESADCPGVDYRSINIDPVIHNEGGEPGGNIRVAIIYDANKVTFRPRPVGNNLSRTLVGSDGSLENNPGRVLPNEDIFKGTRRSLVAEFSYRGEQIFLIGNHFNSKLGDSSRWAAQQPYVPGSELERSMIADRINSYVEYLLNQRPQSNVIVLGDFNAYPGENSMDVLEGRVLKNLMTYKNIVPQNKRYTTTYNGNSQALDFIFADRNLLNKRPKLDVLHLNSDYMGRYSDHDPLVAKFEF